MNTLKKIAVFIFSLISHLFMIGIVMLFFYPIASWYYKARPLFGIDFYNTVSLVNILAKNFVLPPAAWLSNWFGGWPYISQYPVLHFYAILPFAHFQSLIEATLTWMIISTALNFIGIYLLFFELGKSKILAAVLAIGAIYSVGVYGSLLWGGGLPYYGTQAFFPWVLFFLVKFMNSGSRRLFWIAVLLSGLAVWGHPQVVIIYIIPTSLFLLLFSSGIKIPFRDFKKKIGYALIFGLLTFLIGLPLLYQTFGGALGRLVVFGGRDSAISTMRVDPKADVVAFHHQQPWRIYIDTSPIIFVALVATTIAAIVGFVLKPRLIFFARVLPYVFIAVSYIIYIRLYADDISILHGGWYRLFWSVPVWLGMLSATLWGQLDEGLKQSFLKRIAVFVVVPAAIMTAIGIYIVGAGMPFLTTVPDKTSPYWTVVATFATQKLKSQGQRIAQFLPLLNIPDFVDRLSSEGRAALSSAYPMGINAYPLTDQLKKRLLPEFMNDLGNQNQYRLYSADATFNIAWSAYSDIPQARGYLDPPTPDSARGYLFWLDAAVTVDPTRGGSSLVTAFGYPEEVARNHARYLIDWNAIRYFQAGSRSTYSSPLNGLVDNPETIIKTTDVDINPQYPIPILHQELKYSEVNPALTSPIIMFTDVPVVGIVGSDSGFETIVRSFAATNMNSRVLIPVNLGKYLDRVSDADLAALDLLVLYDYDYSSPAGFKRINEYLKKGGRVLIDSGVETKQSDNRQQWTPDFFPFDQLVRKGLGKTWDFQISDENLLKQVDLNSFSPPQFDETEWKQAYPASEKPRNNVDVLLTNQGKPVITVQQIGSGKVVWTGLNFFYHVSRFNNLQEGIFLKNVLSRLIEIKEQPVVDTTTESNTPGVVKVSSIAHKGILFKEQLYPGWQANITAATTHMGAKLYKAGPTYPGFMYLPIPQKLVNQPVTVTFSYVGSLRMWGLLTFTTLLCLFLLDAAVLNGLLLGRFTFKLYQFFKTKTGKWWEKDEEEK